MGVLLVVLVLLLCSIPLAYGAQEKQEKEKETTLSTPKKKNVLLLMSDEHSFRVMGVSGNNIIKTPTMDDLAESGVVFRNAYTQNPVCVPARACLVTGMRPSKVGVFNNEAHQFDVLRDYPITMARSFRQAGYKVEWYGKEHWSTDNEGVGFGAGNRATFPKQFQNEYWQLREATPWYPQDAQVFTREVNPTQERIVADLAIDFLDEYQDSARPFFLGVSLRMPHFPYLVGKKYYNLYKDLVELPLVTQQMLDNLPLQNRMGRDNAYPDLTEEQTKLARAVYYGMVTHMDEQMGRVVEKLDELGLRNDTIVVYLSDHGEMLGEHSLWFKNSFLDDAAKIPWIMSFPKKITPGSNIYSPVQLMDLFPTLCDLCDINTCPYEELDGTSVMPILNGEEELNGYKRHAVSEFFQRGVAGRMVRWKKWKYIWYSEGNGIGRYLYNLEKDEREQVNLYQNVYNQTEYSVLVEFLHKLSMKDFIFGPEYGRNLQQGSSVWEEAREWEDP